MRAFRRCHAPPLVGGGAIHDRSSLCRHSTTKHLYKTSSSSSALLSSFSNDDDPHLSDAAIGTASTTVTSELTSPAVSSASELLRERLNLGDRFGRWRFLQNVLDEETTADDTNRILYHVLCNYYNQQQLCTTTTTPTTKDTEELQDSDSSRVELSVLQRETLERLVQQYPGSIPVLLEDNDDDDDNVDTELLTQLEILLPDPEQDEEGHVSAWDTVMDLHGREAVQQGERSQRWMWKARCCIARLLLHYDFLIKGV